MDRDATFETVKEAVVEVLQCDPATVVEGASFKDDLEGDSLDLVELVMALEERFSIEVPEDELEGITTVGAAVDLVLARAAASV